MCLPLPLLFALATPAIAADDNAAPQAAERGFEAAQRANDRAGLDRLLAPGFLFVRGTGGVGNRQEYVAGFAGQAMRVDSLTVTDRLFLRVTPDVAIAGGEGRIAGTDAGRAFRNRFRFSNTLVLRDGRWLVAYAQVTGLGE